MVAPPLARIAALCTSWQLVPYSSHIKPVQFEVSIEVRIEVNREYVQLASACAYK
jgi:hypothetical protein